METRRAARSDRIGLILGAEDASTCLCQPVQKLDVRVNGAIHAVDFRVFRFDEVVLVRSMRAASVAETKRARGQVKRLAGEYVAGPRARAPRENNRVNPALAIHLGFNTNERGVGGIDPVILPRSAGE